MYAMRKVFTEQQFKFVDGLSCCKCNGPVNHSFTKPDEELNNRRMKHKSGNGSIIIRLL